MFISLILFLKLKKNAYLSQRIFQFEILLILLKYLWIFFSIFNFYFCIHQLILFEKN